MSCAGTVASLATTRKTVDKSGGQEAKVGQEQVRKVTNMLMDGRGVMSMSMGCGKKSDWQTGTGSGWWTTANDWTPWESEEPMGGIEINSMERCWSKNPRRGGKQRTRRWQTSSTSGTSESGRRRRRTPTPRPSPIPKPSEGSVTSEWSETSVSSVGSWTRSFSAMRWWFALQTEDEMRFFDD